MNINSFSTFFKSNCTNKFFLSSERIDIWQFALEPLPTTAATILDSEEQARAERFYFSHHRTRFTAAHVITRLILSRYLNQPPETIRYSVNRWGKPCAINDLGLQFNLSHSGNIGLLAVGQDHEMGVDVEFFSLREFHGIAEHSFSQKELRNFRELPNYYQPLSFFYIWSQKEAFIKAVGQGLAYPLKNFSVKSCPQSMAYRVESELLESLDIISFAPSIACAAALCYSPTINTIYYNKITYVDLQ